MGAQLELLLLCFLTSLHSANTSSFRTKATSTNPWRMEVEPTALVALFGPSFFGGGNAASADAAKLDGTAKCGEK